ncbi:DUF58 domain-containing protein [bacterium]|nr:DUF58 domain-containing protein [bacterium]
MVSSVGWYVFGVNEKDLVISAASFVLVWIIAISALCVTISAIRLFWLLRHYKSGAESLKLETEYARQTDFKLSLGYFPLTEISWTWIYPEDVDVTTNSTLKEITETVTAHHRCQASYIIREYTISDVLGLANISWRRIEPIALTIVPRAEKFNANQVLPSISDGDEESNPYGSPQGDRIDMRKYANGDSSRDIIWKIYARTRKLMIRVPERATSPTPRSCAYLIGSFGDDTSASLARTILERSMLGENWGFGADGTPGVITDRSLAVQAIAKSGNYALDDDEEAQKPTGLSSFFKEAEKLGYNNCLVFIPSELPADEDSSDSNDSNPHESLALDWTKAARHAAAGCHMTVTWLMGCAKDPRKAKAKATPSSDAQTWQDRLKAFAQNELKSFALKDIPSDSSDEALDVSRALITDNTPVWIYSSDTGRFLVYNRPSDIAKR